MNNKPKVFISLNDDLIVRLIELAERTVIYAGPAISEQVAEAIVARKNVKSNLMIRAILNADSKSFRLGYGQLGGLKMLWNHGIDIRCAPGLRIGALLVDDRSWIFSPTPEIILESPTPETYNAVKVTPSLTRWLFYALAPQEGLMDIVREEMGNRIDEVRFDFPHQNSDEADDEILDEPFLNNPSVFKADENAGSVLGAEGLEPQIGVEEMTWEKLDKLELEIDEQPPKRFDHAREILVYNGYLQFVELKFSGGRLSGRTIRLPQNLLSLVDSPADDIEVTATCKIFENINALCPEIRDFEYRVAQVRSSYTRALGGDLGSVILTRNKAAFEIELAELRNELADMLRQVEATLSQAIEAGKVRLIEILLPLVLSNPSDDLRFLIKNENFLPEQIAREYLNNTLNWLYPSGSDLLQNFELRCTYRDVTWEMLNQKDFGDAIKSKFPYETFTKLYAERNTIGERKKPEKAKPIKEDWPDRINEAPTDTSGQK